MRTAYIANILRSDMVLQHRMAANVLCTVWACPCAALNAFWEPLYNHPPCPDTMPLNNTFCSMGALSVKCFVLRYTSVYKDIYCFFQGYSLRASQTCCRATGKTGVHCLNRRWKESGTSHRRGSRGRRWEFIILIGSPSDLLEGWT